MADDAMGVDYPEAPPLAPDSPGKREGKEYLKLKEPHKALVRDIARIAEWGNIWSWINETTTLRVKIIFDQIDTNKDNFISAADFRPGDKAIWRKIQSHCDTLGNKMVSLSEFYLYFLIQGRRIYLNIFRFHLIKQTIINI